jgi:protein-L-isoaspartate(D-aspartate) O-methyltransferase
MSEVTKMLRDIEREVEYTKTLIGKGSLNDRVMQAMKKVPRHEFITEEMRAYAYDNGPVSIGYGQTISQPYIVALMTDLLCPEEDHIVLEIGTGSGYQAAILACLVKKVYSIEIVEQLGIQAGERLQNLGYYNVEIKTSDGYSGWQEHAPYDGIIVTAAATHIPPALIEQLKPGGKLVIPIGLPYMHQELFLVEKDEDGNIETKGILGVAFVPFTGEHSKPIK